MKGASSQETFTSTNKRTILNRRKKKIERSWKKKLLSSMRSVESKR
jgi:hypothetical protein